jgi:hypothetical protein
VDSATPPVEILATLVDLLIEGEYDGAADLTASDRLPSAEIRVAIEEYGRTLIRIPAGGWALLDVISITNPASDASWSVRLPLWTAEEGRSDLEVQATLRIFSDGRRTMSLDNILVP